MPKVKIATYTFSSRTPKVEEVELIDAPQFVADELVRGREVEYIEVDGEVRTLDYRLSIAERCAIVRSWLTVPIVAASQGVLAL